MELKQKGIVVKTFREQFKECVGNGNSINIKFPLDKFTVAICLKHKVPCASSVCKEERICGRENCGAELEIKVEGLHVCILKMKHPGKHKCNCGHRWKHGA